MTCGFYWVLTLAYHNLLEIKGFVAAAMVYFQRLLLSINKYFHLTAITGGLDSKLAAWDFSKGRTLFSIDYGTSLLSMEHL